MALIKPSPELVAEGYEALRRHFDNQESTNQLLLDIANNSGPGVQTLAITEREMGGGIEVDFPVEGGTRWIIPRLATGGTFIIPVSLSKVMEANNRRLGGTVVNSGENNIILTLAGPKTAASSPVGLGQIFLGKNGGSWDFRLGSLMWCGSVCALAVGGESTLTIVEV